MNKKDFWSGHIIFAVILFCFTFVSCLMDIRFVIASLLFHIGHSLIAGLTIVEMYSVSVMKSVIDSVTAMRNVFEF